MKKRDLVNELISFFEEKGYNVEEVDPLTCEITLVIDNDSFIVNIFE